LIQTEQLRLLLSNMRSSLLPAIIVALLLGYTLDQLQGGDARWLWLWCAASSSRKYLRPGTRSASWPCRSPPARAPAGALADAAQCDRRGGLGRTGGSAWTRRPGQLHFGIAVLSGIVGNSMSLLSPVLPVFAIFCVFELGMLALKAWSLQALAYQTLSLAVLVSGPACCRKAVTVPRQHARRSNCASTI
jgi:hypothetical protein